MPRRIVVSQCVSLDGVVQDPVGMEGSGLGDWTGPFRRGPDGDRFRHEELFASAALLLGRVTYDGFAAIWPNVRDGAGFAAYINAMPKFVASATLQRADWNASTILSGDVVGQVRALKAQPGGDILVYGSATLVQALARHGLVDAYNLMVYPTVLGRGRRLFADGFHSTLALEESRTFGSGILLLRYGLARRTAIAA